MRNASTVAVLSVSAACALSGRTDPKPVDPFAPQATATAAVAVAKSPARFVLETYTVKASGEAAPVTITLELDTTVGAVWRFDGTALVGVPAEGRKASSAGPWVASAPESEPDAERKEVVRRMRQIVIPEVTFRAATLADALLFLSNASRDYDPEKKGISFALRPTPAGEEGDVATPMTWDARNVTVFDAFSIVANLANIRWWRTHGGVVLCSKGWLPYDMETRAYGLSTPVVQFIQRRCAVEPEPADEAVDPFGMEPLEPPPGNSANARLCRLLRDLGINQQAGTSASFLPEAGTLTLTNTPEDLARCEELVSWMNLQLSNSGRFGLLPVDGRDGSRALLLSDSETGEVWEYRPAAGADAATAGAFHRVRQRPAGEP